MGHMRHHVIVVTSWKDDAIQSAHGAARFIFNGNVTQITNPVVNGFRSFMVAPDGSKEGWEESNVGDSSRNQFVNHLKTFCHEDGSSPLSWAEMQFGDDDGENKLLRTDEIHEEG